MPGRAVNEHTIRVKEIFMAFHRQLLSIVAVLTIGATGIVSSVAAELPIKNTFVHLGNGVPGVLYEPVKPGIKSQIAVLVMHGGDYLSFSACTELSRRGYRVLCANPSGGSQDKNILDAKLAMTYLRKVSGVTKVVLFGHSGGATLMTGYQYIAEGGVKACQGAEKIYKCPDTLAGLPAADGIVLPDSNWGNAEMTLFSVDPAVSNETNGMTLNADLDMYNPKNGFNAAGSTYSQEFTRKFLNAEAKRYNQLVAAAEARVAALDAKQGNYVDDEPFVAPGASGLGPNNKLYAQDVRLLSRSLKPWPLLKADGSTVTQIIQSVRQPKNPKSMTGTYGLASLKATVRTFLGSSAIRVDDDFYYDESSVHGVHWNTSYASPPGNVEGISVPLLAMGMTGNWEGLAAEVIYEHARSADKSIAFVEGATHMYDTCKECEKVPGQFGDTLKTTYDYIDGWLSKRGRFIGVTKP
jgi:hypothetical protein